MGDLKEKTFTEGKENSQEQDNKDKSVYNPLRESSK